MALKKKRKAVKRTKKNPKTKRGKIGKWIRGKASRLVKRGRKLVLEVKR